MKKITKNVITTGMALSLLAVGSSGVVSASTTAPDPSDSPVSTLPIVKTITVDSEVITKYLSQERKNYTDQMDHNYKKYQKDKQYVRDYQAAKAKSNERQVLELRTQAESLVKSYDKRIQAESLKFYNSKNSVEKATIKGVIDRLKVERDLKVRELSVAVSTVKEKAKLENDLFNKDLQRLEEVQNSKQKVHYDFLKRLSDFVYVLLNSSK